MLDNPIRPITIWWDARNPANAGWAFDHYEVTLPGGDSLDEADLPETASLKDLLKVLRKAVGSRGYVPHAYKWSRTAHAWVAPPKTLRGVVYFVVDPSLPTGWQIKVDGFRSHHPYTALGPQGRVGDFEVYSEATTACLDEARRDAQRAAANQELLDMIEP